MFIDHSGVFFFTEEQWIRAIGRGCAPIFLFLAGYASSYRFRKDLLLLALLLTASDWLLVGHLRTLNILFTILVCRGIFAWLEHHGKRIERPYEWYVGCLAMLATILLTHYGSFGMMFALCGYMQRRAEYYPWKLRRNFWLLTFIAYGSITAFISEFSLFGTLLIAMILTFDYWLLSRLQIREVYLPAWLAKPAKWTSYYSAYIYAIHLALLEWVTGIPF